MDRVGEGERVGVPHGECTGGQPQVLDGRGDATRASRIDVIRFGSPNAAEFR